MSRKTFEIQDSKLNKTYEVETRPTILEQTPVEPKKNWFCTNFENFQTLPEISL